MSVALYTHRSCLEHDPGPGHPESPARLAAVLEALADPRFGALARIEAPRATRAQLARVHRGELLDEVLGDAPHAGWRRLDADTVMSPASAEAALRAAGAACAAVDGAIAGAHRRAFCAVRPPGHHALRDAGMGFCLFGNVAIAAHHARRTRGLDRVLIVDWDVHHGNGTQALVERDPGIHFVSMHQWPWYPGTGAADDRGCGNVWNVPLPGGLPAARYVDELQRAVDRATAGFVPQLVLIFAGFRTATGGGKTDQSPASIPISRITSPTV